MRIDRLTLAGAVLLAGVAVAPAQDGTVRAAADSMGQKLAAIVTRAEFPVVSPHQAAQRTSFTDREVNAYFRIYGPEFLPAGVVNPEITIGPTGAVRARAVVDLDEALKPKERGWLDPLAWVGGKVELTGAGVLHAANGRGVFRIESTTLGGVAVSPTVLQEIVSFYTRTPESPRGFRLDEPFELPSAIRSVETAPGHATVVQ